MASERISLELRHIVPGIPLGLALTSAGLPLPSHTCTRADFHKYYFHEYYFHNYYFHEYYFHKYYFHEYYFHNYYIHNCERLLPPRALSACLPVSLVNVQSPPLILGLSRCGLCKTYRMPLSMLHVTCTLGDLRIHQTCIPENMAVQQCCPCL